MSRVFHCIEKMDIRSRPHFYLRNKVTRPSLSHGIGIWLIFCNPLKVSAVQVNICVMHTSRTQTA